MSRFGGSPKRLLCPDCGHHIHRPQPCGYDIGSVADHTKRPCDCPISPDSLDAAWAAAVAALPEGWVLGQVRRSVRKGWWSAVAWPKVGEDVTAHGPTPAAALLALAAKLREVRE